MEPTQSEQKEPIQVGDFFAVDPKRDCPHITEHFQQTVNSLQDVNLKSKCEDCDNTGENWVCLQCGTVRCSRYVNEHMLMHAIESSHAITLSFSDLSFWCYQCENYIVSPEFSAILKHFQSLKFGPDVNSLSKNLQEMTIKEEEEEKLLPHEFQVKTVEALAQKIKDGVFRRIAFMVGAGISTSAGIPDFRTPGTGLYSRLSQYNLPVPEAVFSLEYFVEHPEAFYDLASQYFSGEFKPTPTHYFMTLFEKKGLLLRIYTQNIDGLERDAGVPIEKLTRAHGHTDSAHCSSCKKEFDIEVIKKHMKDGVAAYCECGKPAKPDIVFFGEQMPSSFVPEAQQLAQADLLIVMGTSLKVVPFCLLTQFCGRTVPQVLINLELVGTAEYSNSGDKTHVFLQGDSDTITQQLVDALGWREDYDALVSELQNI